MRIGVRVGVALSVVLAMGAAAWGIIDVNFTPRELVDESSVIFHGPISAGANANEFKMVKVTALKGKPPADHVLDLSECKKDDLETVQKILKDAKGPVLLFSGKKKDEKVAYLSVNAPLPAWFDLKEAGEGKWQVSGFAPNMSGTYAGGADMLIRMSQALVADPESRVPIAINLRWIDRVKLTKLDAEVVGLAAAEPAKGGLPYLFVASPGGDKLFAFDKKSDAIKDVTASAKLDSRSQRFVWMDVNGDGLADLVGWDGKVISVRMLGKDGALAAADGFGLEVADCMGLSACAVDGKPAVLVSTSSLPMVLAAREKGFKKIELPAPKEGGSLSALGSASPCIAADLDNNGFGDILLPGESGSLLWKGKAGGWEAPAKSAVAVGDGVGKSAVGDFNEDGFLDIFISGPARNSLWENDGAGKFAEVMGQAGSMSYKCPPKAADVQTMDLNHDGRQDVCMSYTDKDLIYHFNRGFRCFGEEGQVRVGEAVEAGQEKPGQRAIACGDFNGDGSLDLAMAFTNGEIWVYLNNEIDQPGVRLRLPNGVAGPVTASLWGGPEKKFCLGAVSVAGAAPSAYLAGRRRGAGLLKFTLPGKGQQSVKVTMEEKTADVTLEAKK